MSLRGIVLTLGGSVLVALKLWGTIDWPWWLVTAPWWSQIGFYLFILIGIFFTRGFEKRVDRSRGVGS